MKITVTQEHIDLARESSNSRRLPANHCPIAVAGRDAGLSRASVGWGFLRSRSKYYELPQEAVDFAHDFDTGLAVEPFTFELDGAIGKGG